MVDLLDALHFMFEDDLAPSSGEQQEARQKNRVSIYTELYGRRSYDWIAEKEPGRADDFSTAAPRIPASASGQQLQLPDLPEYTRKSYIPPTPMDASAAKPFGDLLDAPLG